MNGLDVEGVLAARFHDPDDTPWMGHGTMADTCILCAETAAVLREQIVAAQAEALREFRDHCLSKAAGGPVAPGCPAAADYAFWMRVVAEIDLRAAQLAPARVPSEEG